MEVNTEVESMFIVVILAAMSQAHQAHACSQPFEDEACSPLSSPAACDVIAYADTQPSLDQGFLRTSLALT